MPQRPLTPTPCNCMFEIEEQVLEQLHATQHLNISLRSRPPQQILLKCHLINLQSSQPCWNHGISLIFVDCCLLIVADGGRLLTSIQSVANRMILSILQVLNVTVIPNDPVLSIPFLLFRLQFSMIRGVFP